MGGIIDGLKYGIILNLAAVVLLPLATRFLGTAQGSGGRPFGYGDEGYGFYCSDDGYCSGGGGGEGSGSGGGGHGGGKKKHKKGGHGGYY